MSVTKLLSSYYIDENGLMHIIGDDAQAVRVISHADAVRLKNLPDRLPGALFYLGINYGINVDYIPELPDTMKYLHVVGSSIDKLPRLPAGMLTVGASGTRIKKLPSLPKGLAELGMSMVRGIKHVDLPSDISSFIASGTDLEGKFEIGRNMANLDLSYTAIDEIVAPWASRIVRLDISHSKVSKWPDEISSLTTVKYINVSSTSISKIGDLGPSIMQIDVRDTKIPDSMIDSVAAARPDLVIIR